MKLTVLADNTAQPPFLSEHGFSMLIEHGKHRVLFDTGAGKALKYNANILNIKLTKLDAIVISHGHNDHTGGLAETLKENPNVPMFYHSGALQERFSIRNGQPKVLSMPKKSVNTLEEMDASCMRTVNGPTEIVSGIFATGPVPRTTLYEDTGGPFFLDQNATSVDPIEDDLSLWIETKKGIVLICGCCHSGIINTLEFVEKHNPQLPVIGIVGGLHLVHASGERIQLTVNELKKRSLHFLAPCHCTGAHACSAFHESISECYKAIECGGGFKI